MVVGGPGGKGPKKRVITLGSKEGSFREYLKNQRDRRELKKKMAGVEKCELEAEQREKLKWQVRNEAVYRMCDILDRCSKDEVEFYNRFMKSHPGKDIDARIIYAEKLMSVIMNVRSYSSAERKYFDKQLTDIMKKSPEERIDFLVNLNAKIVAFRGLKYLIDVGRKFFNKYFRKLIMEKKDLPERVSSLIYVALSLQRFTGEERAFFDKFMGDVKEKSIEEQIARMLELKDIVFRSRRTGQSVDNFANLIGSEKTWPGD